MAMRIEGEYMGSIARYRSLGCIVASYMIAGVVTLAYTEYLGIRSELLAFLFLAFAGIAAGTAAFVNKQIPWAIGEEADKRCKYATDNMPLGLLMYDAQERIVVVNETYLRLLGLSRDIVKPGCTFRKLLEHRAAIGNLSVDPEKYRAELLSQMAHGKSVMASITTGDGREISVLCSPLPTGGWIATLEDITQRTAMQRQIAEQLAAEQAFQSELSKLVEAASSGDFSRRIDLRASPG
jgi:PAS domain S-box-containing protein